MYSSLVELRFDFCNLVWGNCNKGLTKRASEPWSPYFYVGRCVPIIWVAKPHSSKISKEIDNEFYNNCKNFRALIGSFSLSTSGQTHGFITYAMRQ